MKTSSDAFLLNVEMQEETFFSSQKKDYFQQRNKHEEKP